MSRKYLLPVFLLMFLFILSQANISATPDKVKGIYLYSSTLSTQGVDSVVNRLEDNSIEQVYLLVKGTSGTMIDSTLLADFITAAHTKGIEVHLWYGISQDAVFMGLYPDAVIYHCPKPGTSNDPYPMTNDANGRLNFLYPGYKQYVLDKIAYLLNNFNCDGIHLDNIRYHHLVYSFDQYHLKLADSLGVDTARVLNLFRNDYANMTGAGWINMYATGDTDAVKWVDMRKNVIYDFISSIKEEIEQLKPSIELSASFTPELNDDAMVHYSQDYTLNSPLLDRIMPTALIVDYGQSPSWVKTVTEGAIALVDPNCKITTGYQISSGVSTSQLSDEITNAMNGGAHGVVGYRFGNISNDQWAIIQNLYLTVVPVELISFSANINSNKVTLQWSTATETNNKGFEVERKSVGKKYQTVAFVSGKGTTTEIQNYSFVDKNLSDGSYTYRLKQIDYDGTYAYLQEIEVNLSIPVTFSLEQNYPNPFNPTTFIEFAIPVDGMVSLKVYNAVGEEISTLLNEEMTSGTHKINFDGNGLTSGIYFYRLTSGNNISVKKMILLK